MKLAVLWGTLILWTPAQHVPALGRERGEADANQPRQVAANTPTSLARADLDSSRGMADWLVNLARHQGHLVGRADPRSASLHVLALLEAAVQLAPDCAEGYYWLYDLQQRMGQASRAEESLANYVRLAREDDSARIRLLELRLEGAQTAEKRIALLRSELKEPSLSPTFESDLRFRLARHHYERRETEQAGQEIENALRLNPLNIPARELAFTIYGETEPELQRVELALQLISANPTQVNLVWELGEYLDRLSLHRQAQEWYNRAIEMHRASDTRPIPAAYWHQLGVSYLCSRDYARAREAASAALAADGSCQLARLLRASAQKHLGDEKAAEQDKQAVRRDYEARRTRLLKHGEQEAGALPSLVDQAAPAGDGKQTRARQPEPPEGAQGPPVAPASRSEEAAEVAWYYCFHQPEKDAALQLAQLAMQDAEPSSLAKLAYGYALRLNGRIDDAVKVLEPLATIDQMAALELARILAERSDKAAARTLLHKAAAIQRSGIAFELIREQLNQWGEQVDSPPAHAKITAALEKFPRDVFDFHKRPVDFLRFSMRLASAAPESERQDSRTGGKAPEQTGESPRPARPEVPALGEIRLAFRLENVGPFTISLGEGYMVRPLVALSAQIGGSETVAFRDYLQVLMNARPVLIPGDAIEKTIAVDVGHVREFLLRNIAPDLEITFTAMLDPVRKDGELRCGPGTITPAPLALIRKGLDLRPESIAALLKDCRSSSIAARMSAAQGIAAILAYADRHRGDPRVAALPVDQLSAGLAKLFMDPAWQVRAYALVGAGWSPMDAVLTQAAAPNIQNENAVIKLLAIRLFAPQHGDKFRPVLEKLSKTDPSHFVRMMALSFLPEGSRAQAAEDPEP